MAEEQKRVPRWLVAGAVVLAILGTTLGLTETVGRWGTLVGRWEPLHEGVEMAESDLLRRTGQPSTVTPAPEVGVPGAESYVWEDGPAILAAFVYPSPVHPGVRTATVTLKGIFNYKESRPGFTWHIRRWAEKAYTAIHGPRR